MTKSILFFIYNSLVQILHLIFRLNLKSIVKKLLKYAGLCLCLLIIPLKVSFADATVNQLKVVYLYQFTQFITWPADVFASPDTNFQICVLGESTLDEQLKLLEARHHGSHPIIIRYPKTVKEVVGCHLLYIGPSASHFESDIFKQYKNTALLTVSSQPDFIKRGGMIGFVMFDERLRLNINRTASLNANIKLSAQLMEVAVSIINSPVRELSR